MRAARYIPTRWMIERSFLDLKIDTRLFLIGLWTWPETPTSGLTVIDPARIGRIIGISSRRTRHCIVELEQAGFIAVDPESIVIWLIGYLEAQLGAMPNMHHKVATKSQIRALPNTDMIRRYRVRYGIADTDLQGVSDTVVDRVSDTVLDTVCDTEMDRRSLPVLSASDPIPKGGRDKPLNRSARRRSK